MPESASLPDQLMATGAVNHERASGARAAAAVTSVGAVWSILTVAVPVIWAGPFHAVQSTSVPLVSAVRVLVSQPSDDVSPRTVHLTVTGPTNQPSLPAGPVSVKSTTGSVANAGPARSSAVT